MFRVYVRACVRVFLGVCVCVCVYANVCLRVCAHRHERESSIEPHTPVVYHGLKKKTHTGMSEKALLNCTRWWCIMDKIAGWRSQNAAHFSTFTHVKESM